MRQAGRQAGACGCEKGCKYVGVKEGGCAVGGDGKERERERDKKGREGTKG